ncbi:MAG TPA: type II secretion system protein [Pseudobacteroides sp.]|uniref:type II secretion system protein n=1 Tax=Pseudobacteroides sp. TaxID=1968840 RepID=UPI002F94C5EC
MGKLTRSKKGFTIVELIISVTLLAIITVPLMAGFANIALINKLTRNQIEINAVARQVQQEVIDIVKKGGAAEDVNGNSVNIKNTDVSNIKVGQASTENAIFKYDVDYIAPTSSGVNEYIITLYKKKGTDFKVVQRFKVYVSI